MSVAHKTDSQERAQRRGQLAKIHIYKKRLRLDDGTYRSLLSRITGLNSAADLNAAQRAQVLDEMKRLFAPVPTRQPGVPAEPQLTLIRGLWSDCAMYGIIRDRSERALTRFARRVTKVDALQWLSAADAASVITA
jgi:phage gp16-like protein